VVSQDGPPSHPVSVREFVEMGRHPYVQPWARLREEDREAVRSAIRRVDLEEFEERPVNRLSGGEVQRAKLARAFAQGPEVLVLDEPTAHLDIGHEMQLFSLVRDFVDEGGSAVTITHNLHLASRFADRLLLLDEGRLLASGPPGEVLRGSVLSRVFRWPVRVVDLDSAGLSGLHVVPVDPERDRGPGVRFDGDGAEEGSP
jgi:iron complex transport system ATP-binding protein